jgi:hypothetical protein
MHRIAPFEEDSGELYALTKPLNLLRPLVKMTEFDIFFTHKHVFLLKKFKKITFFLHISKKSSNFAAAKVQ